MRITGSIFWGLYLIIVGSLFLLRQYFQMNIPVFRLALGAFLIMAGLSFLFGNFQFGGNNDVFFSDGGTLTVQKSGEYNVVFGSRTVDVSRLEPNDATYRVEVNTIFSSSVIYLDPDVSYRISGSSAFGSITFPDGHTVSFGEGKQTGGEGTKLQLDLELSTVFGRTEIRFRGSS